MTEFVPRTIGSGPIPSSGKPESANNWGVHTMAFPAWLFPPVKGGLFTGHLTTLHWTDQGTRCKLHGFDMEVEITTKFPLQVHLTCYGLKVDAAAETVMHVSSDTQCCECHMHHHPERTVVELCAGLGDRFGGPDMQVQGSCASGLQLVVC